MKTGIITFHFPYNCGAVLQCAALQTVIRRLGHQVSVINYRPWYHQNRYTYLKNPFQFAKSRYMELGPSVPGYLRAAKSCMGFVRAVGSWRHYGARKKQDDRFSSFIETHLDQTKVYRSLARLRKNPPDCDLYISGSDQLWNCHLTEKRFDRAYFLDFGADSTVRVSYAVGADFTECEDSSVSLGQLLERFDAISLREDRCLETVREQCGDITVTRSIDPTLLLDAEDYLCMESKEQLVAEPYILTYTMPNASQSEVYDAAELLSKKTGVKVVDISGNPSGANRRIPDNRICGPDEFLRYMRNADYVLTNSFHGTAFSVIMRKRFAVIPHTETGNRVTELLDSLALSGRYADSPQRAAELVCENIDYSTAEERLAALREQSMKYLRECAALAAK